MISAENMARIYFNRMGWAAVREIDQRLEQFKANKAVVKYWTEVRMNLGKR